MEYFGRENMTRVVVVFSESLTRRKTGYDTSIDGCVDRYEEPDRVSDFLCNEGLFGKYIYTKWQSMGDSYDKATLIHDFKSDDKLKAIVYDDEVFYVKETETNRIVYKEIPRYTNDSFFHWILNEKYGARECTLERGPFKFVCTVKENDELTIEVKYTKCENRHRNTVTIATIEVFDGTNEIIKEAINAWGESFTEDLVLGGFKENLRKSGVKGSESIKQAREWNNEILTEKKRSYDKRKKEKKRQEVKEIIEKPKKKRGRPRKTA